MTVWRISGIALLLMAAAGGYYVYDNYLNVQTVTTSIVTQAPVSEAIYGTGTVEPQRYIEMLAAAGFRDAQMVALTNYRTAPTTIGAAFRALKKKATAED